MKSPGFGARLSSIALVVVLPACGRALQSGGPVAAAAGAHEAAPAMFDGRTLQGWEGDPALWRVEDGAIVGHVREKLDRNEFLVWPRVLRDFRLSVEVKLETDRNNSGIQFRSRRMDENGSSRIYGYQADIGGPEGEVWGALYHEHGRGFLSRGSCRPFVKPNDWNHYEIVAVGSKIHTTINDHLCVDLDDPAGEREGIIAVQLHSGGPMEVRFRNFHLETEGLSASGR